MSKCNEDSILIFGGEYSNGEKTIYYDDLYRIEFNKKNEILGVKLYSADLKKVGPSARSSH